jgi:2-haloacid dehalogenase
VPNERVVTFDFYGTLVQWHEGVEAAFSEILTRRSKEMAQRERLIHDFQAEGKRLRDTPPWRSYRDVLRESLSFAMDQAGLAMSAVDLRGLIGRLSRLPAHPEVPAALASLKKRYRLAAISNTDDDLIAGSLPSLGVDLDAVVTAQQARAYKPDLRLFRFAHEMLGVTPHETVHVAASQPLDMAVCKELGIRAFWVNRRGEEIDAKLLPFSEVADLSQAARLILN